jgi:hypothetical protein
MRVVTLSQTTAHAVVIVVTRSDYRAATGMETTRELYAVAVTIGLAMTASWPWLDTTPTFEAPCLPRSGQEESFTPPALPRFSSIAIEQ